MTMFYIILAIFLFLLFGIPLVIRFYLFLGWLLAHGLLFPKTAKKMLKESLDGLRKTNSQLDLYTEEMEKQSSGIFRVPTKTKQ